MHAKEPLTLDEMLSLLRGRGLHIGENDGVILKRWLYDNNYYRLSAYFRPLQVDPRHGKNSFKRGTHSDDFMTPYFLDQQLRSILQYGTAKVEQVVSARFAYLLACHGHVYDYLRPETYLEVIGKQKKRGEKSSYKEV